MPTRRAPYNTTVQIGFQLGGLGPFIVTNTTTARVVPVSSFIVNFGLFQSPNFYVTMPANLCTTGTSVPTGLQTWTRNYQTASRLLCPQFAGVLHVALQIDWCITRGGVPYWRVWVKPVPP